MKKSIELIERELEFINYRIKLIRQNKVYNDKGISLKEALLYKEDYEKALKKLKN